MILIFVVCRIFLTCNAPAVSGVEVDPPGVRAGETRPAPRTAQPRTAGARTIAIHPCSLLRPASAAHTAVSANLGFCEDCPRLAVTTLALCPRCRRALAY